MENIEKYENFINEGIYNTGETNADFNKSDYWTLITIIACENYPKEKQGMSDTAQSIYNRYNVPGQPYGKTIKDIILSSGQYSPVSKGKSKGAKWGNIQSIENAIEVYRITKGVTKEEAKKAIDNAVLAQKDVTFGLNAGKHVQSRTEFLANPPSGGAAKPVERVDKSKNNSFFWKYSGKKNFYDKKDFSAKSKPKSVNIT